MTKAERREMVLARFGVTPAQVDEHPKIEPALRRTKFFAWKVRDYLAGSSEPDARKFLAFWDSLSREARSALSTEDICVAAGLTPKRLYELISWEVLVQSKGDSPLLAAAAHLEVTQATIDSAKAGDTKAQKMLHQHAEFLPLPKSQFINLPGVRSIDASQKVAQVTILPSVESNVKRMADRFGEKLLPEAPGEAQDAEFEEVEEEEAERD